MYKNLISNFIKTSSPQTDSSEGNSSNRKSKLVPSVLKEVVEHLNGSALSSETASTSESLPVKEQDLLKSPTEVHQAIEAADCDEMDEFFDCEDSPMDLRESQNNGIEDPIKSSITDSAPMLKGDIEPTVLIRPNVELQSQGPKPSTAEWILSQVHDSDMAMALAHLRLWTYSQKAQEIDENLVCVLKDTNPGEALGRIKDLHDQKHFVLCRQDQHSERELDLDVEITDIHKNMSYRANALLDSGCTGSCINRDFVEWKGLHIQKFEYPITSMVQKTQMDQLPSTSNSE